ncbi:juvenile hormone esterase-like isoform X2 [Andrena cerasifolii]|uniref:juvenile hormone esterase-like isoform X2 n=1 Tax=Andrena cerasifolii TaxID=2819439 RepID=UPI004037DDD5
MYWINDFHEGGARMKSALLLVTSVLVPLVRCQNFTQIVDTDKGRVRGRVLETAWHSMPYSAFMGIPFAKPPVGDLRFRDPIESDPWTGVLNATDEPPACIQHVIIRTIGQEDCLYLNVYTGVTDFRNIKTRKPVMVWIYGGVYILGLIWHEIYGPDFFLEEDVIIVAMNYRLGPLGFLALGMDEARGNQALKDQNLALQWVQKNIANFGGDPNRVTLFGQSAGSVSTLYHLLSPKSDGLFQQAIGQSGSPLCTWGYHTPAQSVQIAYEVGKRMGIRAQTKEQLLDSLKQADAADMAHVAFLMTNFELPLPIRVPFTPTIDTISSDSSPEQVFLDDCPISKFESGNFSHLPIMLGFNEDEGIFFVIVLELVRQVVFDILQQLSMLDFTGLSKGVINVVNGVARGIISTLIQIMTVHYFSEPIDITQKYLVKHNADIPVYYYRLSYSTERSLHKVYNPQINGTAHVDDIGLLFYIGLLSPIDPDTPYNQYRKKLVSLWTNFAKYGNPTPNNQPINGAVWLPSGEAGLQLDIGNEQFQMHDRLLNPIAQGLEPLYITLLKLRSNCPNGSSSLLNIL